MGVYQDYLQKIGKKDEELKQNLWNKSLAQKEIEKIPTSPVKSGGVKPIKFSTPDILKPKLPSQVNTPVKQYNTPISTKPNPYLQVARPITNNISLKNLLEI